MPLRTRTNAKNTAVFYLLLLVVAGVGAGAGWAAGTPLILALTGSSVLLSSPLPFTVTT